MKVMYSMKCVPYYVHCVKSVGIRNYSGPYFPAFGLNTERYGVSEYQFECRKMRTRVTYNTDIFHAMMNLKILALYH